MPGPIKGMPLARETATARAGPVMTRMGAAMMRGEVVYR